MARTASSESGLADGGVRGGAHGGLRPAAARCAANFLDAIDISGTGPTLPKIEHALRMSPAALQWVVSAYVLGYGGFLLLGGRIADLFSRRRLLLGSLVVFAVASLVGGFADSGAMLIAARLVKGISAAFMAPAALAILLSTSPTTPGCGRCSG